MSRSIDIGYRAADGGPLTPVELPAPYYLLGKQGLSMEFWSLPRLREIGLTRLADLGVTDPVYFVGWEDLAELGREIGLLQEHLRSIPFPPEPLRSNHPRPPRVGLCIRPPEWRRMGVPDDWSPRLASAIAAALWEFSTSSLRGEPVIVLDVGCFPWHGSVELSALTATAFDADPALAGPGEQAAWPHYDFAAGLPPWGPAAELGRRMADAYNAAGATGRPAVAEAFLRACTAAIASPEVQQALAALPRDPRFRVSVAHPDDGRQFWPPS